MARLSGIPTVTAHPPVPAWVVVHPAQSCRLRGPSGRAWKENVDGSGPAALEQALDFFAPTRRQGTHVVAVTDGVVRAVGVRRQRF